MSQCPYVAQRRALGRYFPATSKRGPIGHVRVLGPTVSRVRRQQPSQANSERHGERRIRGGVGVLGTCPSAIPSVGGRSGADDCGCPCSFLALGVLSAAKSYCAPCALVDTGDHHQEEGLELRSRKRSPLGERVFLKVESQIPQCDGR